MSERGWLVPQGTMLEELSYARREVPELRSRVAELEAEIASALPAEHYLRQLRQIASIAIESHDLMLTQLGDVLDQALDVVEVHQRLIEQRLEELEDPRVCPVLQVIEGGRA